MKMKELEHVSGLGRETIRYYIREGLLPEPERPKRNVAVYTDAHVKRLNLIKRLQAERHLPLSLIKSLVMSEAENPVTGFEAFIGLENRLGPLLSEGRAFGARPLAEVLADVPISLEEARVLEASGVLMIERKEGGEFLNQRNARLLELIGKARVAGYTPEASYTVDIYGIYAEMMQVLAHHAVAQFYRNLGTRVDYEQAANMAAEGVNIINEMMQHMFVERIIHEVERVTATGTLEDGEE
ncbi:MAG: MerR family transcriptional regulator [Parvibaculum sp.]|nr:MerR family transcriptional regulator [Parvibaculum sp.]